MIHESIPSANPCHPRHPWTTNIRQIRVIRVIRDPIANFPSSPLSVIHSLKFSHIPSVTILFINCFVTFITWNSCPCFSWLASCSVHPSHKRSALPISVYFSKKKIPSKPRLWGSYKVSTHSTVLLPTVSLPGYSCGHWKLKTLSTTLSIHW